MKTLYRAALCSIIILGAADAENLKIDKSRSRIQVDGKSTAHGFTGTLKDYTTTVSGDLGKLDPTEFELDWKFSDLNTEDKKRDENMIKWLGGGTPKGSFKFVKTWQKDGKKYAQGILKIHGVSKTIAFPYTVKKEADWITIDGKTKLNYKDFKLPLIRALAVLTVDPELTIRFHLVGKL